MKLTRSLKITITKHRLVRQTSPSLRAICPVCAREVETLSTFEAAAVLGTDKPAFDSLLAAGQVHALRMVGGSLRVCRDSLQ